MITEDIKSLITETLQRPELSLQVNQTSQQLSIVINRPKDLEVDYEELATIILEAFLDKLMPEDATSIYAVKFFGRIKGQSKQEWQKVQKLNYLPHNKVAPITEINSQINPAITLSKPPIERHPPLSTASKYQSVQTPRNSSISALHLINNFKFGELLTVFKDIISTGALVGIF